MKESVKKYIRNIKQVYRKDNKKYPRQIWPGIQIEIINAVE
jgi:hypothetical protein